MITCAEVSLYSLFGSCSTQPSNDHFRNGFVYSSKNHATVSRRSRPQKTIVSSCIASLEQRIDYQHVIPGIPLDQFSNRGRRSEHYPRTPHGSCYLQQSHIHCLSIERGWRAPMFFPKGKAPKWKKRFRKYEELQERISEKSTIKCTKRRVKEKIKHKGRVLLTSSNDREIWLWWSEEGILELSLENRLKQGRFSIMFKSSRNCTVVNANVMQFRRVF